MAQLFTNNAASFLALDAQPGDTSITLAPDTGAKFPNPTNGDFFLVTLTTADGLETAWEIVKATARFGDVLTVTRAQEGTTPAFWGAGSKAEARLTAGAVASIQEDLAFSANTNADLTRRVRRLRISNLINLDI